MGRGLGHRPGEIAACVELIDAHPEECRFSLLRVGLSLDDLETGDLSWADCWAVFKVESETRGSPLDRARTGEESNWSFEMQMLATIADLLAVANWQRGGGEGSPPDRIPRPGVGDDEGQKHIEGESMSIEEMDQFLAQQHQAAQGKTEPDDPDN